MVADRAVSTTVGYAMTLTITTLLVTGLLIAGGDFVDNQRDGAARNELRVLGQQVAADVAAADRLARTSGADGDLTVSRSLPRTVTGATYAINVSRVGTRNTYEMHLESDAVGQSGTVRVYSTTPVFARGNLSGGDIDVEYNSVTEQLAVKKSGPYVFQEEGGQVVIEAESFPRDHSGSDNASAHYWKAVDDASASGGTGVVVLPDEGVETQNSLYGPRLEYQVNFQNPGEYYIWLRANGSGGGSDSVHVALEEDGSWKLGTGGGEGLGANGGWDWVNTISNSGGVQAKVTVDDAGTHTVGVWMREDATQIDKIVLNTTNTAPSGTGPEESDWQ